MSGVRLMDLEASDMVDVLHFIYEEDVTPAWEQGPQVKSKVRESLYGQLYGRTYKYSVGESASSASQSIDPPLDAEPLPPEQMPRKPYVRPTDPEDLPALLGPPMGG